MTMVSPDAPIVERDTLTCRHCQAIVFTKPGSAATVYLVTQRDGTVKEEAGAFCRCCMGPVCLRCDALGRCLPWERQLERSEARARFLRSVGVALLVVTLLGSGGTAAQFIAGDRLTGTTAAPTTTPCTDAHNASSARYMDAAAVGTGTGATWANAWTTLSEAESEVTRGQTVCVADGSYGGATFNLAASGSTTVAFIKATAGDHGSDTGWSAGMGDGQAVFGELNLQTDYWAFNGQTRNDANWNDETVYGFRATALDANSAGGANGVACTDDLVIQYMAVSCGGADCGRPMHMDPEDTTCGPWTLSYMLFYNSDEIQLLATDSVTFEYVYFRNLYGKEAIRAHGGFATNTIIRYSVFDNSCRDDNNPGGGCTAEIGFFGEGGPSNPDDFTGTKIYGNVFWKHMNQHKTDATINVDDRCEAVFNNTISDDSDSGTAQIRCLGGVVRNNIIYRPNGIAGGFTGTTADNNSDYTTSPPFTNVSTGDFSLTGALAGVSTGSPAGNSVDRTGATRGNDGTWDRGAFEYGVAESLRVPFIRHEDE